MNDDIIDLLKDLHKQAISEKSHFYVGKVIKQAIEEIESLREREEKLLTLSKDCNPSLHPPPFQT